MIRVTLLESELRFGLDHVLDLPDVCPFDMFDKLRPRL